MVTLRELQPSDAPSLLTMLSTREVARFISPAPATLEGFERFIAWAQRERQRGTYVCYAVVPHGLSTAVGCSRFGSSTRASQTPNGDLRLARRIGAQACSPMAPGSFSTSCSRRCGVHRLEARAAVVNGRGNGALRKMGAVQEAVLRSSFLCDGTYIDQTLWSILDPDWRHAKAVWGPQVVVH